MPHRPLIRLATPQDGAELASIYAPAVVGRSTSFELDPPDGAEMARRVEAIAGRTPWLVCVRDDKVVGYAYGGRHRERAAYQWSVEVSAYVAEGVQRAGVARALYTSLFAVLALQGYRNAYAGITLPNAASEAFHEAIGFSRIGIFRGIGYKLGEWHDVIWLERALRPRDHEPAAPVPLSNIMNTPDFRSALATGLPLLRLSSPD